MRCALYGHHRNLGPQSSQRLMFQGSTTPVMRNNGIHDFRPLKVFVRLEVRLPRVARHNYPAQEFAICHLQFDTR